MSPRRALLSVSDKEGLVPFAQGLVRLGFELLATGGTRKALEAAGVPVMEVATYTGFPEMMDGRVKTLHPRVHGGLLGRPDLSEDAAAMKEHGITPFELVVVNLYPFVETISKPDVTDEEAIEQIDIGGPAMLRSAAKNHKYVGVVTSPTQYDQVLAELEQGMLSFEFRRQLAGSAFVMTARYDVAIAEYFGSLNGGVIPDPFVLIGHGGTPLRYGENPHQKGMYFTTDPSRPGFLGGELVFGGKDCSYVNIKDLDAVCRTVNLFEGPSVCINKHASPCGVASGASVVEAFVSAYLSDEKSAFGGVIGVNRPVDLAMVEAINRHELFVECIAAPDFLPDAFALLQQKKNIRLLRVPLDRPVLEVCSVTNGFLVMEADLGDPPSAAWKVQSNRQPTELEWISMRFAWKACQPVLSNAIVLAQGTATVGIGGGQPNRIDCVEIAIKRAGEHAAGSVMASDSFFPFRDCIDAAAKAGVTAVVYQGGGKQEAAVIAAANELNIALVMTGIRHFRH